MNLDWILSLFCLSLCDFGKFLTSLWAIDFSTLGLCKTGIFHSQVLCSANHYTYIYIYSYTFTFTVEARISLLISRPIPIHNTYFSKHHLVLNVYLDPLVPISLQNYEHLFCIFHFVKLGNMCLCSWEECGSRIQRANRSSPDEADRGMVHVSGQKWEKICHLSWQLSDYFSFFF